MGRASGHQSAFSVPGVRARGSRGSAPARTPSRFAVELAAIDGEGHLRTLKPTLRKFQDVPTPVQVRLIRQLRDSDGAWREAETLSSTIHQPPHHSPRGRDVLLDVERLGRFAAQLAERPPGYEAEQTVTPNGKVLQRLTVRQFLPGPSFRYDEIRDSVVESQPFDPDAPGATAAMTAHLAELRVKAARLNAKLDEADADRVLRAQQLAGELAERREAAERVARTVSDATADITSAL